MTDHARFRALLEATPEFDLEPDEQAELDAHLEGCDACRAYGVELAAAVRAVAELPPIDAPARVRRGLGLDQGASGARPRGGLPRWAAAVLGLAAAAAPLTIAALLLGGLRLNIGPFIFGGAGAGTPAPAAFTWTARAIGEGPQASGGPSATGAPVLVPPITVLTDAALEKGLAVVVGEACPVPASNAGCAAAVATSTDAGATWARVSGANTLSVQVLPNGVPGGIRSVVPFGGGFVAVGATGDDGATRAAVWSSPDGQVWTRVDDPSFAGAWMNAIAATEDRVVAVGGRLLDGRVVGASWASADGETWTAGPADDPLATDGDSTTAGSPDAGYVDVVSFSSPRWVAIGRACQPAASCRGVVRTSVDGLAWMTAGGDDPFAGGIPVAIGARERLVAVGARGDRAAAWFSGDGSSWAGSTIEAADPPGTLTAIHDESGLWWAAGVGPAGSVVILGADEQFEDDVVWGRLPGPTGAPGGAVLAFVTSGDGTLAVLVGTDAAGRGLLLVGDLVGAGQP